MIHFETPQMTSLTSLGDVRLEFYWSDQEETIASTSVTVFNPAEPQVLPHMSGPFDVYFSEPTEMLLTVQQLEILTTSGQVWPTVQTLSAQMQYVGTTVVVPVTVLKAITAHKQSCGDVSEVRVAHCCFVV